MVIDSLPAQKQMLSDHSTKNVMKPNSAYRHALGLLYILAAGKHNTHNCNTPRNANTGKQNIFHAKLLPVDCNTDAIPCKAPHAADCHATRFIVLVPVEDYRDDYTHDDNVCNSGGL